jgi:hypothetical protein
MSNPTAAQTCLAIDVLTSLRDVASDEVASIRKASVATIMDALSSPMWIGNHAGGDQYGKPPTVIDPGAQVAMRALSVIIATLSMPDARPMTLDDVQGIVQGAAGG